jgi:hypothetical protein
VRAVTTAAQQARHASRASSDRGTPPAAAPALRGTPPALACVVASQRACGRACVCVPPHLLCWKRRRECTVAACPCQAGVCTCHRVSCACRVVRVLLVFCRVCVWCECAVCVCCGSCCGSCLWFQCPCTLERQHTCKSTHTKEHNQDDKEKHRAGRFILCVRTLSLG